MKCKFLFFFTLLFLPFFLFSQNKSVKKDSIKKEPIIFGEFTLGISRDLTDGVKFLVGGGLKYQYKNHLFSFRYNENIEFKSYFFFVVPIVTNLNKTQEQAIMYGKRWVEDGTSYSLLAGLSTNRYIVFDQGNIVSTENYGGIPFEANIKWFKSKKSRFRIIYGAIPIGKPTSFGRSIGFKLVGNISKRSYVGIGLTFGIGIHKQY